MDSERKELVARTVFRGFSILILVPTVILVMCYIENFTSVFITGPLFL